jgi:hypothetical protein
MKNVFTHIDSARVGLFKSLLETAGIGCFIRNEISGNMLTGVPIPVFYPSLCVINDADYDRAVEIINEHQEAISTRAGEWVCPNCQSVVPAGFDTCWKCEQERPGS